jgi:hypothetical protein
MKRVLIITLIFFPTSIFAQKAKSFEKWPHDEKGHIYYEEIYNVSNREPDEIMGYAVQYANYKGAPVSHKSIENNEITFEQHWKFAPKGDICVKDVDIVAQVTISAKLNRTRILVHDFTINPKGSCGSGRLEDVMIKCPDCTMGSINQIMRWIKEEVGEHFMWDYKHQLEKYTEEKRRW